MGAMTEQIEREEDRTPHPPWGVVWVVLVALVGVAVAYVLFRPHTYAGSVLQAPVPAESLDELVFSDGRPADLAGFRGDVVLVYFGYTNCPDICPTTLARAAEAKRLMGRSGDDLQVLMVSVDPERDTQEALAQYMAFFDDSFLGVTGPVEALERVATLYGIYVKRNEGTAESGYTVDHTGTLMAIDPEGYLRVIYPNDVSADALASDLRALLET
jgi:protein SCO1/2